MDVSMPDWMGSNSRHDRQHPRFNRPPSSLYPRYTSRTWTGFRGISAAPLTIFRSGHFRAAAREGQRLCGICTARAQLETLNNELRRLSSALLTSQDEERRRIARELHDGFGQETQRRENDVMGIVDPTYPYSGRKKRLPRAAVLIDRRFNKFDSMSLLLHPPLLDGSRPSSALEQYLEGFHETQRASTTQIEAPPGSFRDSSPNWRPPFSGSFRKLLRTCSATRSTLSMGDHCEIKEQIALRSATTGRELRRTSRVRPGSLGIGNR